MTSPFDEHTGGPAFPIERQTIAEQYGSVGMSLRDYFAAKAMQGMMVEVEQPRCHYIAEVSYKMADAMLEARDGTS